MFLSSNTMYSNETYVRTLIKFNTHRDMLDYIKKNHENVYVNYALFHRIGRQSTLILK